MTGYTDQTQSVTVTAGKTTSVTLTLQKSSSADPIIGGWRQVASGGYDDRYRFNADGTWKESYYFADTGRTAIFSGTWIAKGDNSYTLRVTTTGITWTMIYDPAQNGIYDPRFPSLVKYPYTGDIAPASSSVSSPIIGVWRYDCQTFDDRYHFYADGTYVESFYSYTRGTLSVYSGTWTANTGNSYTLLMTGESPITIIYDPVRNTIYDTRYAPLLYRSYQGDVMKGIVSSEIKQPVNGVSEGEMKGFILSGTKQPVTMFSESEEGNIQFVLNDKARMIIKA